MHLDSTTPNPEYPAKLLDLDGNTPLDPPIAFGPFDLTRLVRQSHMSLVCRGVRREDGERLAVKICLPTADRARFRREIQHTRSIGIQGVIKIEERDVGMTQDGLWFYATRWIDGPSLGEFLQNRRRKLAEKVVAVAELARVVAVLHEKGLSHRDLKPSNVMLEDGKPGELVLLDLGLARAENEDYTRTGAHTGGTPGYFPAWSTSNTSRMKDYARRWDVYSLAVILVEALTGKRPAGHADPDFTALGVKKLLRRELPTDRRFDGLLERCLADDPKKCLATADEFYRELRRCTAPHRPASRFRRALVAASSSLVLLALGHEIFRAAAPARYETVRTWLLGRTNVPPTDSPVAPLDPRILSYSNAVLKLVVSPIGAEVRVINHRANGMMVTNATVPDSGRVELSLPDNPNAQYGLQVLKAGYHENMQPVEPSESTVEVHLEPLRGEVEFRSTEGASVELSHTQSGRRSAGPVPADGRLLVQSLEEGDWDWRIARADYETNSGRIVGLVYGKRQIVESSLKPLPGRLSVVGHASMEIWEGSNKLGSANDWIQLAAGPHELELRRPGFRTQRLNVVVPPNRDLSQQAGPFVPAAGSLRVAVEVPPEVADWFANASKRLSVDVLTSSVPVFPHLVGDLSAGAHQVGLEVEGFAVVEPSGVVIQDGQTNDLQLKLKPLPARLTVMADPADAEVFRTAGDRLGRAGTELQIAPGVPLAIEVRAAGYESDRVTIPALPPGGTYRHEARLKRPTGPVLALATKDSPWVNSLQMKFVRLPGTDVLICIWATRVQDFEAFVKSTGYDATQGMYSLRKDGWKQRGDTWRSPGFAQGPTHPVVGVSYEDAVAFCEWLSQRDRAAGLLGPGQSYRLPTDAEWSLAVGDTTYPWGNTWPPPEGAGNYAGQEAADKDWPENFAVIPNWRDAYPRTAPVDALRPNRLGLHIGGNVWEWCSDWYVRGMNTEEFRRRMPALDQDMVGTARVLRGAAWNIGDRPDGLASGCRGTGRPNRRNADVGFRVVLDTSAH